MRDASCRELAAAGSRGRAEGPGRLGGGQWRACLFKVPEARGRSAEGRRGGAACLSRTARRRAPRFRVTCGEARARRPDGAAAHGEREQAGQRLRPGRVRAPSSGLWRPRPRRALGARRSGAAPARPGPRLRAGQSGGAARWVLGAGAQAGGPPAAPSPASRVSGAWVSEG